VKQVKAVNDATYYLDLENAEVGRQIFDLATRDGYIPTFSQQPPTLEEIFKQIAGENNE
jgi:ABC-2 type transport system ATP-binding protein